MARRALSLSISILVLNVLVLAGSSTCAAQATKEERIKVGKSPGSIEVADFNHDGIPELAVASESDSSVTILLGKGNGDFKQAEGSPFYAGNAPNDIAIAISTRTGRFITVKGSPFPSGGIPNRVAIGDVNGDGVNDVAVSDNGSNKVYVFLMSKKGILSHDTVSVGNHPKGIALADINGDGKADIVVCNNADNDISIVLGK